MQRLNESAASKGKNECICIAKLLGVYPMLRAPEIPAARVNSDVSAGVVFLLSLLLFSFPVSQTHGRGLNRCGGPPL